MKQDRKTQRKLEVWRDRYGKAKSAYSEQLQAFSEREELYKGVHKLPKLYKNAKNGREPEESVHCWNIVAEHPLDGLRQSLILRPPRRHLWHRDRAVNFGFDVLRNNVPAVDTFLRLPPVLDVFI